MSNIINYSNMGVTLRDESDFPLTFDEMDSNFKFLALCCKLSSVSNLNQDPFNQALELINAEDRGEITVEQLTSLTQTFTTPKRYYGSFVRLTSLSIPIDENVSVNVNGVFNTGSFDSYDYDYSGSELTINSASIGDLVYVVFNTLNFPT